MTRNTLPDISRHCLSPAEIESMAVSSHLVIEYRRMLTIPRPILTPKTVLPIFFVVGIIFAPIGGLLLWASSTVRIF